MSFANTIPTGQTPAQHTPAGSRPWLAMALTFLFLGIGYALPLRLAPVPPSGMWQGAIAPEVLNLYALTVFAGWAHFFYAWRGQFHGASRLPSRWRIGYWIAVVVSISLLILVRSVLGVTLFSALVWIWFIAHFVKAELVFAAPTAKSTTQGERSASWQPVLAFAWLSFVLFSPGIDNHRWLLFLGCLALALATLFTGGWQHLARGTSFLPALALFFTGEAFVWGTYGQYMHPAFRVGIYVFHIAGASFFHYFGSYAYGQTRAPADRLLRLMGVILVNCALIAICCAAAWQPSLRWLSPLLGLEWFTFWVAAHLASSDLLPIWKRRALQAASIPQ